MKLPVAKYRLLHLWPYQQVIQPVDVSQFSPIMSAGDLERIGEKARTELTTLITPMAHQGDATP
jgi:hypothetical protein